MADAYQPYQNPSYQAPAPWANANTYAPWETPNGETGQNSSFGGMGGGKDSNYNYGGLYATSLFSPAAALFGGSQGWFGSGKKRGSPDFSAPSYQGHLFTPSEGMPQWFGTSQQGQSADAMLQNVTGSQQNAQNFPSFGDGNMAPSQGSKTGESGLQSYGYDTMPSYIGQTPYLGNTVNNYSPNIGGNYGGYSSYGGYGNSKNTNTSPYQPYVPTGYSSVGQY